MNFDLYENTLDYPCAADFTTTHYYRDGACIHTRTPSTPHHPSFTDGCIREVIVDKAALKAAQTAYYAETSRLQEQFKQDLFAELEITNHPMREKMYSQAWDDGHSSGLSEVYNCALSLVNLIEVPAGFVLVSADTMIFGSGVLGLGRKTTEIQRAAELLAKTL